MTPTTLLMPLLNEGVDVWRPVAVRPLSDGTHLVLGPMPDDELWTFPPGSVVASRSHTFGDGVQQLVVVPIS